MPTENKVAFFETARHSVIDLFSFFLVFVDAFEWFGIRDKLGDLCFYAAILLISRQITIDFFKQFKRGEKVNFGSGTSLFFYFQVLIVVLALVNFFR